MQCYYEIQKKATPLQRHVVKVFFTTVSINEGVSEAEHKAIHNIKCTVKFPIDKQLSKIIVENNCPLYSAQRPVRIGAKNCSVDLYMCPTECTTISFTLYEDMQNFLAGLKASIVDVARTLSGDIRQISVTKTKRQILPD